MTAIKILLFDIDGTLLSTGGAGRRTMDRIFFDLWGVENAFEGTCADGKTDPMIFREMLKRHWVPLDDPDRAVAEIRHRYEEGFADEMRDSPAVLMPGVDQLLDVLSARGDVAIGLLTGNLEVTARVKVEHFGLGHHFHFGAFSSDHEIRRMLPPIAVERASAWLGQPIALGHDVVIIGDTPHDVDCALTNGCTAIGVGTGGWSPTELKSAGAHATVEALTDVDRSLRVLGLS